MPEAFNQTFESTEGAPTFEYTIYKKLKPGENPQMLFSRKVSDPDAAYNEYIVDCLEKGIRPVDRKELSINTIKQID